MRLLFAICVFMFAPMAGAQPYAPQPGPSADQQASALFDTDWQWRMRAEPEYATMLGDSRYNAHLSDTSIAGALAATAHQRSMLEQALRIERARLSAAQQLSVDLFVYEKQQQLKAAGFTAFMVQPISNQRGIHISFEHLVAQMPFASETDYRNYIARIEALPAHIEGLIEHMRAAMKTGWVAPRSSVHDVPRQLALLRTHTIDGTLGLPFRQIPSTIDQPSRDALAIAGPATLAAKAVPAWQALEHFLLAEYLPAARDSIAASALPGGQPYYAVILERNTTSALTPSQVHALGLAEVARIRQAMVKVVARTGFAGDFTQFVKFANTDPRLFYSSAESLLTRYRKIVARADASLPLLFEAPPNMPLLVKPSSALDASGQGAAYYEAGSAERPAAFVVNTTRLHTRPIWEMETLALHEALPGHHLQVARAASIDSLPPFRRHGWYVAYGEGWAMYAETLGPELGFFKDSFSAFGHLNSQLFRAARMVVDTGIHAMGWSARQALDYLNTNTGNPPSDNAVEVDRYIAWPGQAPGYKLGQLRIEALRAKAETRLGPRFNIRRFHAALLDQGALPLDLLEQQVDRWIEAAARRPGPHSETQ
jgi:uncharacterized protein (DUF885 family)